MLENITLDNIFSKISKWFTKDRKITFIVTFIIGLLVHFTLYSNELLAYDAYWHYGSFLAKGWEISLGRFLIPFSDILRGSVVGSILTTTISLITISFSAIFLNEALHIKKNYLRILTSILIVVTPTLSLTLMYPYTANGYTFAMLFAVLSIYFINKDKKFQKYNIYFNLHTRNINLLMATSLYILIIVLIKQIELIQNGKFNNIIQILSYIISALIIWTFILSDNATYIATKLYNNQMYAVGNRILTSIDNNAEITDKTPIVILGHLDFSIQNESLLNLTNFDVSDVNIWTWQIFLQDHLGIGRNIYTMKNYTEIMNSEEFINMPIYPSDGCTKIINGTAVVKLNY